MKKDIVLIKKKECLTCYHLSKVNTVKNDCLKEKGCPANYYEIVIGLPMLQAARKLSKAFAENDSAKISAIMKRLEKAHPTVKDNVLNKAKALLGKDNA